MKKRMNGRLVAGAGALASGALALVAACSDAPAEGCYVTRTCPPEAGAQTDGESSDTGSDASAKLDSSMGDSLPDGPVDSSMPDVSPPGDAGCVTPTSLFCNGTCVDPTTTTNCGACGHACPGPDAGMGAAQCSVIGDAGAYECTVQCSGTTSQTCGGNCYEPTDVNHCGSCNNVCLPPTSGNGIATCSGATPSCGISCNTGYHVCSGECESDSDVPSNTADQCILSDTYGVFVATPANGGSDATGQGTAAAPFATITKALANLGSLARVYVCNGDYSDAIDVTQSVGIYGGLTCAGGMWAYAGGGSKATVTSTSTTGGPALTISNVSGAVDIEDMAFVAQDASAMDASGNGHSSIAVFASDAANVLMRRCSMSAGNGMSGASPGQLSPYMAAAPNGRAGSASKGSGGTGAGGVATPNPACTTSIGGAGGSAIANETDGQTGQVGPDNAGTAADCNLIPSQGGGSGMAGAVGALGVGASLLATFSAAGWTPNPGEAGGTATAGQGGGGGGAAGTLNAIGGGGGGGAGGCGGAGGPGGGGGGSSIAVLLFDSTADLENCALTATTAGAGGDGAQGQLGQQGGSGGPAGAAACNGGAGGQGGQGGGGGGGAGGVSAGIVWTGTPPTINSAATPSATTLPGIATGTAGVAGTGGQGNAKAGAAGAVVQFQ